MNIYETPDKSFLVSAHGDWKRCCVGYVYGDSEMADRVGMRMLVFHFLFWSLSFTMFRHLDPPTPKKPERSWTRQSGKKRKRKK